MVQLSPLIPIVYVLLEHIKMLLIGHNYPLLH